MRLFASSALVLSLLSPVYAVFQDEAYHTDFHHALLGTPQEHTTFFHRPQSVSKASLLYTLSEKGILGAVNPRNGSLVWRQVLGDGLPPTNAFLRAGEDEDAVVGAIGDHVSSWSALDGKLVWSNVFGDGPARDLEVLELEEGKVNRPAKDVVTLFGTEKGVVKRLDGATGDVKWEFKDQSGDLPYQVSSSATSIYYISLHPALIKGYKIKVTTLDALTGAQTGQYTLNTDSDVTSADLILFVGSNAALPVVAWTDPSHKTLKVNLLGSRQISTFNVPSESGERVEKIILHAPHVINSVPHFLVHYQSPSSHSAEVYHIDLSAGTVSKAYSLPKLAGKGTFSTTTVDANVFFTRSTQEEFVLVSSASHGILGRWPVRGASLAIDAPVHGVSEVVAKTGSTYAVRSAVTLTSGEWQLIRNGDFDWSRPEYLAGVVAADWAELEEQKDLARELEVEGHENVLSAYIHRVKRHLRDLEGLPAWIQRLPSRLAGSLFGDHNVIPTDGLHADSFGFRKLILVATENGRVLALDSGDVGKIVWATTVIDLGPGKKWDVKGMLVNGDAVQIRSGTGEQVTLEVLTGKVLQREPAKPAKVESTAIIEEAGQLSLLSIYEDETIEAPELIGEGTVIVLQGKNGNAKGVQVVPGQKSSVPVWEFAPPAGERIVGLTSRAAHDPVASIGKVLGDRSVMYKYLNPNLLLVTTVSDAQSTLSFHLLDSTSGNVLYTASHEGVATSRPITSALSENWFTYAFWADVVEGSTSATSKGYQLVVAELYESSIPNDRGLLGSRNNYSSVDASATDNQPHVISQAYRIPEEISGMTVTQTRQGITSRELLCTLSSSNAIVAIPRMVLDPRRPLGRDPTPAEAEEGLFRYVPTLEFNPQWIITHKREVAGIDQVITSPTLLESTSLVFAYGLDVFGTRVAPSRQFDILGKEFGKVQLIGTVLAVAAGVAILAPMVRRKQINAQWQSP
ncbi:DUF1620 domain protein [Xylona heveae TC161]|uniref:ER membrane protein complex subunit 1 n=1 Tax=Xylona heveae (strain CBS 132557 / TC161) TaxID=1328760 RepID=A0A165H698_XYLHT|nr:DUF1620 domain protein [Xylona heveae TC161]KZF23046.1 DUF1620 domain protein [Xylona heveae TC161]